MHTTRFKKLIESDDDVGGVIRMQQLLFAGLLNFRKESQKRENHRRKPYLLGQRNGPGNSLIFVNICTMRFLILIILLLSGVTLSAQSRLTEHTLTLDAQENAAQATISDFHWMAGRWEGTGFGGWVEENWNPAVGGTMIGSYRLVKDSKPDFYEFLALVPDGESITYRVKHFTPDLVGWEEKDATVDFPLVKVEHNVAYFSGLTVKRDGDNLTHHLALKGKDGGHQEVTLSYTLRAFPKSQEAADFEKTISAIPQIPLLMLGSYHMSNPGMDRFNLEADDVTTPKRQEEIQAVVDRLALWKPTKVAVEGPLNDSLAQARYQAYLRGEIVPRKSEEEQIGFRLAKQLGHDKIYPIDVRMMLDDEEIGKLIGSNPQKYGRYMAELEQFGGSAMQTMGEWLSTGTIGKMLYNMNDPDLIDISHGGYFRAFVPIGEGDNYAGTDMLNTWYHRNLRIFSNLHKIQDRPDDRIFIVYGAGHIPLLRQFAKDSPYFRVEDVQDYLRGL